MSKSTKQQADEVTRNTQQKASEVAKDQGIENPGQAILAAIFAPLYLAGVPVAIYLTRPGGVLQSVLQTSLKLVPGGPVPADRVIPAMAAVYAYWAYAGSGTFSVAAQGMARKEGFDNNHPRAHQANLRGLPLRMRSAHLNLVENFPAWAIAAALQQAINPRDQHGINLLAMSAFLKMFVFWASYLADLAPPRSMSFLLATSSVVGVCWRLAVGA